LYKTEGPLRGDSQPNKLLPHKQEVYCLLYIQLLEASIIRQFKNGYNRTLTGNHVCSMLSTWLLGAGFPTKWVIC